MRKDKKIKVFNCVLSYRKIHDESRSVEECFKKRAQRLRRENKGLKIALADIQQKYGKLMSDSLNAEGMHMNETQKNNLAHEEFKECVVRYVLAALINIGFTPTKIAEVLNRFKPIGG